VRGDGMKLGEYDPPPRMRLTGGFDDKVDSMPVGAALMTPLPIVGECRMGDDDEDAPCDDEFARFSRFILRR
jgi:hypothetical protein